MMTCSGALKPSIVDFDKEAKYVINTNPDNKENWWSQYYDGLKCYLHSTDPDEADRADCFVILEADSRDEIAMTLKKNCNYDETYQGYEQLNALEYTEFTPTNSSWVGSEWEKWVTATKYLMGTPMNLEDLIPLNKEAAKILIRVARFMFEDDDPEYVRIKNNCAEYL